MQNSSPQTRKPIVAAILPAYNEENNVAAVIDVLLNTNFIDEIILIDDGSRDGTHDILRHAAMRDRRVTVIHHDKNKGKGQAIFSGWSATIAPYILMLDADLKNLTPDHLRALMTPILEHRADMTMGLFTGGRLSTDLSHRLTPFLTGQRGMRAEILRYVSREAAKGYGFEVALTVAVHQQGFRKRVVYMKGVWHPRSELRSERGFWYGFYWKLRMYKQIIRAWYIATRERYPNARAFFLDIIKP